MAGAVRNVVVQFIRKHPRLKILVRRVRQAQRGWQTHPSEAPPPRRKVGLLLPRLEHGPRKASMTAPRTMYIPRRLLQTGIGGYESDALACFLAVLDLAPPGPVWDVGANVGVYGLVARAASDREVIAFEPTPDLAAVARAAADDSDLPYRVMEIALADEPGELTLYLSDITDSSNSLAQGFRKSSQQLQVAVDTADGLIASGELRAPAVLKVDTETTEPAVLRGALALLKERRPWLLVEVLWTKTEAGLMDVLEGLDYSWYHISGDPPYPPQSEIVGDSTHQHFMWMFTPEPLTDEFYDRVRLWEAAIKRCVPTTD